VCERARVSDALARLKRRRAKLAAELADIERVIGYPATRANWPKLRFE
jgi:hypothetical protein